MHTDVSLRITRSDGKEFLIDNKKWLIPNDGLENWATLDYGVTTQENATFDGSTVTHKRINQVDRSVTARLADAKLNEEARAEAIAFFNPKHSFKAYLTYMGRTRYCEGEQYGFSCSVGNIYRPAEINWTILCANPFLMEVSDHGFTLADTPAAFGFPYMSAVDRVGKESALYHQKGFITAVTLDKTSGGTPDITIDNTGDVETALRVEMVATGSVTKPTFTIGSNTFSWAESLKMKAGQVLVVDLQERPPSVTLDGSSVLSKMALGTNLPALSLPVGDYEFSYSADSGAANLDVTIFFRRKFLGI